MTADERLAERLARTEIGEDHWPRHSVLFRRYVVNVWLKQIKTIRRAGLELVEREDGR